MTKTLSILGGYGRAGRAVSRLVAKERDWTVICAGRTASKAEAWANQLGIDWATVDVDRPDDLVDHLRDVDAVLVALPFQGERSRAEGIVDAAIQTGTDYLDIIPDPEKWPVLQDRDAAVQKAGLRLLTEGGIVPGMPSALVRRELQRVDEAEHVEVACVMRDPQMGTGGMHDIVAHLADPARKIDGGELISAGWTAGRCVAFGPPYGDLWTIPSWLRELDRFEGAEGIERLRFQQAGMHPVLDAWFALLLLTGLARTEFGVGIGTAVGDRLNRWLAPGPSGLMLQCTTRGRIHGTHRRRRTRIFHPDVYTSTAIATVAALDQLLDGTPSVGIHAMGHAVDPEAMLTVMKQLGMRVDEVSSLPDGVDQ